MNEDVFKTLDQKLAQGTSFTFRGTPIGQFCILSIATFIIDYFFNETLPVTGGYAFYSFMIVAGIVFAILGLKNLAFKLTISPEAIFWNTKSPVNFSEVHAIQNETRRREENGPQVYYVRIIMKDGRTFSRSISNWRLASEESGSLLKKIKADILLRKVITFYSEKHK